MSGKSILMIEDDPFVSDWVDYIIRKKFGEECTLEWIRSELEFLVSVPKLEADAPAAIILDLILPWEGDAPMSSSDHKNPRGDIYEAGIRVLEDLRRSAKLKSVPVLLYTVNDRDRIGFPTDLKERPEVVQKGDPDHVLLGWLSKKLSSRT